MNVSVRSILFVFRNCLTIVTNFEIWSEKIANFSMISREIVVIMLIGRKRTGIVTNFEIWSEKIANFSVISRDCCNYVNQT